MVEVVRGRRRTAGWTAVTRGVYVAAPKPALGDRLRAWSLHLPDTAVLTHLTAAELRGWWLPDRVPQPVFAAVGVRQRHPQRAGLHVTRLRQAPAVEEVEGVRVATSAATLLACARDLGVLDLVILADSALRLGHCTIEDLAGHARGQRGAPALRAILPLLDPRSESPWESVMRVLHRAADIEVEPQHEIHDDRGAFVARADLWLVRTRRIHEYDGEVHRTIDTHRDDLDRDRRLLEIAWERCGWTSKEVLRRGASLITSADTALGRRWDPDRLRAWQALVADSLYGSVGRTRVASRWS